MAFTYSSKLFGGIGAGGSGVGTSSTTQVLFNSSGSVAGDAGLTYDAAGDTLTTGRVLAADGTASAPAYSFVSEPRAGMYADPSYGWVLAFAGAKLLAWNYTHVRFPVGAFRLGDGGVDTWITNDSTSGLWVQRNVNEDQRQRSYAANGAFRETGSVSELTTIADAAYTDTVIDLPANSLIRAVVGRVVTVIPTAATFTVGDPTTPARFATGATVAAGDTFVGLVHVDQTGAAGPKQTTAAKVRITPNATPAAATGQVRLTIFYDQFVPGTT